MRYTGVRPVSCHAGHEVAVDGDLAGVTRCRQLGVMVSRDGWIAPLQFLGMVAVRSRVVHRRRGELLHSRPRRTHAWELEEPTAAVDIALARLE